MAWTKPTFLPTTQSDRRKEIIPDDRRKRGKADRDRVSTKEKYEVSHEAKKMGVTLADVERAAKRVGPMRKEIEAELRKKKIDFSPCRPSRHANRKSPSGKCGPSGVRGLLVWYWPVSTPSMAWFDLGGGLICLF
jgi:hypothetical protein